MVSLGANPRPTHAERVTPAESVWPAWSLDQPETLARYLLPSEVTKRLPIPGPGSGSPISRVKAVYEALLRVDGTSVRYAFEKDVVIDGSQVVRTPAEVLVFPGNGTCLDLALVLAAALHAAQLPVAVVVLDDGSEQARRHALVAVHVGTECPTWWSNHSKETVVWTEPPPGLREELADSFDGPGDVLLIDPNGVSVDLGTSPAVGLDASFADAVSHGADYFGSWQWLVGVVPGSSVEPFHPADAPSNDPLAVPYLDPQSANGPLEYLRPEYRAIPFQGRNERTILEDLAEDALTLSQTRVAIVHGAGGSGKTRLALEVADRLRREGWYAGVLPQGARDVEWLAQVVTPLCLVVDYAEGRLGKPDAPGDVRRLLGALRARRPGLPVLLILTARTVTGGWVEELHNELQNQRQFAVETRVPLPNKHPDSGDLYKRTVLTLNPDTAAASLPAVGPSWTTLDYILLGWLAANTTSELPARKADLYDSALAHEAKYWVSVYRGLGYELDDQGNRQEIEPDRPRLRLAAAALTLAQAEPDVVDEILATLPSLKTKERERALIERTLLQCLANSEIVAVRPDPIGDHLVLTDLTNTPNSAAFAALTAPEAVWTRALSTINRAGQNDHSHATAVIGQMLTSHPDRWPAALDLALLQGGPVSEAIESHVHSMAPVLPLDHLSEAIPFTELITSPLGLHVDQARLASARQTDQPPHVLAALLQRVAERHRLLGDPAGALAAIEEAVTLRRELAATAPAVYTPNLAMSLNNLSNRRSGTGDPAGALAAIEEAVTLYRELAATAPAVYTADLAASLNNLSAERSGTGDPAGALAAIEEAVTLRRELAATAPAVYTADLAMSLNNLSNRQVESGFDAGQTREPWLDAITAMPSPAAAAELQIQLAKRLATPEPQACVELLTQAATVLDAVDVLAADRTTQIVTLRARAMLRRVAIRTLDEGDQSLIETLPMWATRPVPEECLSLVNALNDAASPVDYLHALTEHADLLTDTNLEDWLSVIVALHPGQPGTTNTRHFAADIRSRGMNTVLTEVTDLSQRLDLLAAWITTRTWAESQRYLEQHAQALHHPTTRTLLAGIDHPNASGHAAILELADDLGIPAAYQITTDLDHADEAALAAIDQGRLNHLTAILTVSPLIHSQRATAALAYAVHLMAIDDNHAALKILEAIRSEADQTTRHSHAIHLKRLAKHHPNLTGLSQAREILEPNSDPQNQG